MAKIGQIPSEQLYVDKSGVYVSGGETGGGGLSADNCILLDFRQSDEKPNWQSLAVDSGSSKRAPFSFGVSAGIEMADGIGSRLPITTSNQPIGRYQHLTFFFIIGAIPANRYPLMSKTHKALTGTGSATSKGLDMLDGIKMGNFRNLNIEKIKVLSEPSPFGQGFWSGNQNNL